MQTKLQKVSQELFQKQKKYPVEVARQRALIYGHTEIELGLRMMIDGIELYLRGKKKVQKITPIKDAYLKEMANSIVHGVHGLLNESGHFDANTCSKAIALIKDEYRL